MPDDAKKIQKMFVMFYIQPVV